MADSQALKSLGLNKDSDSGSSFPPFFWCICCICSQVEVFVEKEPQTGEGCWHVSRCSSTAWCADVFIIWQCTSYLTPPDPVAIEVVLWHVDDVNLFFWWNHWWICWAASVERRELHLVAAHVTTGTFDWTIMSPDFEDSHLPHHPMWRWTNLGTVLSCEF